jgi:hypothetical protein
MAKFECPCGFKAESQPHEFMSHECKGPDRLDPRVKEWDMVPAERLAALERVAEWARIYLLRLDAGDPESHRFKAYKELHQALYELNRHTTLEELK